MYQKKLSQISIEEFVFPFGKLDKENRWVKLSEQIPWIKVEKNYAEKFKSNKGNPAKNVKIALGSLIIKQILNCSDEATVSHVSENPYLQYFLGLTEYTSKAPFSSQSMTEFRKRFSEQDILNAINDAILEDVENIKKDDNDEDKTNHGTIAIDATCAPADISFPQDIKLLNEAREKSEKIIDELHKFSSEKKPRTYRREARKEFLKISKAKNRTAKFMRKGIKKQINYLKRNLKTIEKMKNSGLQLREKSEKLLETLKNVFTQQQEMIVQRKHSVENRIVSISQPHVRPIPRGKAKAKTEFGAKVEISIVNEFARLETLKFDAYNEGQNLIGILEKYKNRNGFFPERVLVDKLYRNRENLKFCKEHNIQITGPALGRPKKNLEIDKKAEYKDICDRNCVEGKFGEGKTTYGLGRIFARLKETSITVINLAFIVMNLQKKVRLTFTNFLENIFMVSFFQKNKPNNFFRIVG